MTWWGDCGEKSKAVCPDIHENEGYTTQIIKKESIKLTAGYLFKTMYSCSLIEICFTVISRHPEK